VIALVVQSAFMLLATLPLGTGQTDLSVSMFVIVSCLTVYQRSVSALAAGTYSAMSKKKEACSKGIRQHY